MKNSFCFLISFLMIFFSCNDQEKKKKVEETSALTEQNACLLSQIAYCTDIPASLNKYMPGWKIVWEATALGGNHAFVATRGKEYALAIRGSLINFSWAAFQNWIYQDLHVTSQEKWAYADDSSKARLSEGSYHGWQNLCRMADKKTGQLLLPFLENELKDDSPLLITGHSLGGNLATVYASYLLQTFRKNKRSAANINVITFAAPAAGNETFANDLTKKFPGAIRIENENDIVPKFPCASKISALGNLFTDSLSAGNIMVGYKNVTVSLGKVFVFLNMAMSMLEFSGEVSRYVQPNGDGKQIRVPLSGKNSGNDIMNWLSEAGYQHSVARYAVYEKVPVVECAQ